MRCVTTTSEPKVWFGLQKGIGFYDGENWKEFTTEESGIVFPIIALTSDEEGVVYTLASNGLFSFDGERWEHRFEDPVGLGQGNRILTFDDEGNLWFPAQGVICKLTEEGCEVFAMDENIYSMSWGEDSLWIIYRNTRVLLKCPIIDGKLSDRSEWRNIPLPIDYEDIYKGTVHFSETGRVWVATVMFDDLVHEYNPRRNRWINHDLNAIGGSNGVSDLMETSDGSIWCASSYALQRYRKGEWTLYPLGGDKPGLDNPDLIQMQDGRLVVWDNQTEAFIIDTDLEHTVTYKGLIYQCEDRTGKMWFLSLEGGIVAYYPEEQKWWLFDESDSVMETPNACISSSDGSVWVAGSHEGVAAVNRYRNGKWSIALFDEFARAIGYKSVLEAQSGTIYFGCSSIRSWDDDYRTLGLLKLTPSGDSHSYEILSEYPTNDRIVDILELRPGELVWGGFQVQIYQEEHDHVADLQRPEEVFRVWTEDLTSDSSENLWLSFWGSGIYRFDGIDWLHFSEEDGLSSSSVTEMLVTDDDSVWAVTSKGVCRFDGERWYTDALPVELAFGRSDGLIRQGKQGEIWISHASYEWFYRAIPEALRRHVDLQSFQTTRWVPDKEAPETLITYQDKKIPWGGSARFSWSGSDRWNRSPRDSLTYSYRVDGGAWSTHSGQTTVFLSDLSAGKHWLEVRARDTDFNVDPTPAILTFEVTPPVWMQLWFISLSVFFISVIAFLVFWIIRQRIRHLVELDRYKLKFFTNLSHELRTPLTIMLGPIERLKHELKGTDHHMQLELASRGVNKMVRIVNQILDLRKLEVSSPKIVMDDVYIEEFFYETASLYFDLAHEKNQSYLIEKPETETRITTDRDKLQKILDNLIFNAIKYTPETGEVSVSLIIGKLKNSTVTLTFQIADTGPGIPQKERKRIFDPYYRTQEATDDKKQGSGIGLALTKEFVDLLGGRIEVSGNVASGKSGAVFEVSLPVQCVSSTVQEGPVPISGSSTKRKKRDLLIVEDNADVRAFLVSELVAEYQLTVAANGKEALEKLGQFQPDLILSDIMMPEMDGLEFCRAVKRNPITSHIPIIFLTARQSLDFQMEGLRTGAIDYVTKPFSPDLLRQKIRNVFKHLSGLRRVYAERPSIDPAEVTTSSADEAFLEKAIRIVEDHLSDFEFNVDAFARELCVSRSSLFLKFKAMTDDSPAQFIKKVRMQSAARLLESGKYTVTEVAEKVGFLDLSNFSANFKKQFKKTPSEYMKDS